MCVVCCCSGGGGEYVVRSQQQQENILRKKSQENGLRRRISERNTKVKSVSFLVLNQCVVVVVYYIPIQNLTEKFFSKGVG